jgi:hypothetical protein
MVNRMMTQEDLERILLGWDYLEGEMVTAPELTNAQLVTLKNIFGKAKLLAGLREYQQSSIHMSYDKTMSRPEQLKYGHDVEKLQSKIEYIKNYR